MRCLSPLLLLAACSALLPTAELTPQQAREELQSLAKEMSRWSRAFSLVHEAVAPSVVAIHTKERRYRRERGLFGGVVLRPTEEEVEVGEGSGFVIRSDGATSYLLTNAHVVLKTGEGQQFITDRSGREMGYGRLVVELNDGREVEAEYVGWSTETDLAVLKVPLGLPAVEWADSDRVHVGDWVVALGYPLGVGYSASSGIISATDRSTGIYRPIGGLESFLQTDAAINPGNSGGPLVNLEGRIVGVNANIVTRSGGSMGLGFAISSNLARRVGEDLIDHGGVRWPGIGIEFAPLDGAAAADLGLPASSALRINGVLAGSPAAKAGLAVGDVLLSINGIRTTSDMQFRARLRSARIGDRLAVQVWRDGARTDLQVVPIALEEIQEIRAAEAARNAVAITAFGFSLADDQGRGLVVTEVVPGSPAHQIGTKPGDRLLQEQSLGELTTLQDAKSLLNRRELVLEMVLQGKREWVRLRR